MPESTSVIRDVQVVNPEGLHARPVMRFVDLACSFQSRITVINVSRGDERLDGKSAMQLMLLDAPQGSIIRIEAAGEDAAPAVAALADLVAHGFAEHAGEGTASRTG